MFRWGRSTHQQSLHCEQSGVDVSRLMVGQKAAFMPAEAECFLLLICNELRAPRHYELLAEPAQREYTKHRNNSVRMLTRTQATLTAVLLSTSK
jgi:hypothetical protein